MCVYILFIFFIKLVSSFLYNKEDKVVVIIVIFLFQSIQFVWGWERDGMKIQERYV